MASKKTPLMKKMLTPKEKAAGVKPMYSKAWHERREARKLKQANQGK